VFTAESSGVTNIYAVKEDGSDFRRITNESSFQINDYAIVLDGTHIVLSGSDNGEQVYLLNLNNSSKTDLKQLIESAGIPSIHRVSSSVSPNGQKIVVHHNNRSDLSVFDLESQTIVPLLSSIDHAIGDAFWSPDGQYIAYNGTTYVDQGPVKNRSALYLVKADGTASQPVLRAYSTDGNNSTVFHYLNWAPDAKSILFLLSSAGMGYLIEIPISDTGSHSTSGFGTNAWGNVPEDVARLSVRAGRAEYSPNGEYIVFYSSKHNPGDQQLYVAVAGSNPNGTNYGELGATRITNFYSPLFERFQWSPDSERLLFRDPNTYLLNLMVIDRITGVESNLISFGGLLTRQDFVTNSLIWFK